MLVLLVTSNTKSLKIYTVGISAIEKNIGKNELFYLIESNDLIILAPKGQAECNKLLSHSKDLLKPEENLR